jgi:hypothetical protein
MPLASYGLKRERMERSTGCICNVIVAEDRSRASRVQEQNRRRIRGIRCLDCPFWDIDSFERHWGLGIRNSQ